MTRPVFRKASTSAPAGYFRWEATGLRWLRAAYDGAPVADVLDVSDGHLDLVRLTPVSTDPLAAEAFGVELARVHDAGARAFGVAPEGWTGDGWLGPLNELLPLQLGPAEFWGQFWAESRILPVLRAGVDRGVFDTSARRVFEALANRCAGGEFDDGATPARIHGDLWSGNLMWTADGVVMIDPAAHGGHRETDLAMLALFDCPHLELILGGYQSQHRLDAQWPERVSLHQVHPLMLHAVIFGGSFLAQAVAAARRYL